MCGRLRVVKGLITAQRWSERSTERRASANQPGRSSREIGLNGLRLCGTRPNQNAPAALTHLRRELGAFGLVRHGSNLSRSGASGKPGAVHSGETDRTGRISKCGDGMLRSYLYE